MSSLDRIVKVVISRETRGIASANFETLLHISDYAVAPVRTYSDIDGISEDYPIGTPTYNAGLAYFTQELAPQLLKIGGAPVAAVLVKFNGTYTVGTINTTVNSDEGPIVVQTAFATNKDTTLAAVASDVAAAVTDIASATYDAPTETITYTLAADKYVSIVTDVDATGMTEITSVTANADTLVETISAIQAVDNQWYGITVGNIVDADRQELVDLALWAKAQKKFCFFATNEVSAIDTPEATDTTSLPAMLNAVSANKAAVIFGDYIRNGTTQGFLDVAWASMILARNIGSYTTVLQQLTGVVVTDYTTNQYTNLMNKNVSVYNELYGQGITEGGRVTDGNTPANGEWIDVEIGLDLTEVRMQEKVFYTMVSAEKIPYTNQGAGVLEAAVADVLQRIQDAGFYAKFTTATEDTNAQSTEDRAARRYNGISWDATLAGAIHNVTIQGVVRV